MSAAKAQPNLPGIEPETYQGKTYDELVDELVTMREMVAKIDRVVDELVAPKIKRSEQIKTSKGFRARQGRAAKAAGMTVDQFEKLCGDACDTCPPLLHHKNRKKYRETFELLLKGRRWLKT